MIMYHNVFKGIFYRSKHYVRFNMLIFCLAGQQQKQQQQQQQQQQ